jgi:hypothetical protein
VFNAVIPNRAPFFQNTAVLRLTVSDPGGTNYRPGQVVELQPGVDYAHGLPYYEATSRAGQPINGGWVLTDRRLSGTLSVDYVPLGGEFEPTQDKLSAVRALNLDLCAKLWDDVFAPGSFPEVQHVFEPSQKVGYADLLAEFAELVKAVKLWQRQASPLDRTDHIRDFNNPHGNTKATYGLGLVPNWAKPTEQVAAEGKSRLHFVTPKAVAVAMSSASVLPTATDIDRGYFILSSGTINDAVDKNRVLTAAALLSFRNAQFGNPVRDFFSSERIVAKVGQGVIPYPVRCAGATCHNFISIVKAVEAATGFTGLKYNFYRGEIYFPAGSGAPTVINVEQI